jgi:hypothetical protein
LKLSELINLEVQFLRDEQTLAAAAAGAPDAKGLAADLARRDRAIGHHVTVAIGLAERDAAQRLARDRGLRHAVCQQWLAHLPKATRQALPGERIERGYRLVGWLLFALFSCMGIGTAAAALLSSGAQPVNVLVFVVVFFLLQILLLAMYPVLQLIRRVRGGSLLPWLQGVVVHLSRMRWIDRLTRGTGSTEGDDLEAIFNQLRLRQTIYGGVQQWLLFTFVQRMATGFNLAALVTSLYMVTFHDLAFGWSTTLDIKPAGLADLLAAIATPWSWVGDFAAPSISAIEVSRFVPAEGGYLPLPDGMADGVATELRRTWWPFLVAGLITWGLLPRVLAYTFGAYQVARTSRRLPLNHTSAQHLYERMFPAVADWRGPAPESVRGGRPRAAHEVAPRPLAEAAAGPCFVVCWGTLFDQAEAVGRHMERRFGHRIRGALGAGLADLQGDEDTRGRLRRDKVGRVIIALPEGQQPTKELMRFLKDLRQQLGKESELVIGLLAQSSAGFRDVDPGELDLWRERLLAEADPYLSLQSMECAR